LEMRLRILMPFQSYYNDLTNSNTIALTRILCTSVSIDIKAHFMIHFNDYR